VVMSQAPQFLVDKGNESLECVFVALSPMMQKGGDLAGLVFGHAAPLAPLRRRSTAYSDPRRSSIPLAFHRIHPSSNNFAGSDEAFRRRFPPSAVNANTDKQSGSRKSIVKENEL
jgi:hypothetical protein